MEYSFIYLFLGIFRICYTLDLNGNDNVVQLTDIIGNLTKTVDQLNKKIGTLEQEVAVLKVNNQPTSIAFSAAVTKTTSLGDQQLVEFDHVYTNIGNAYDPRHSHFVAPVRGTYVFSLSVTSPPNNGPRLQIVKNGNVIAFALGPNHGSEYGAGSVTTVVSLEANDMVWVRHHPGMGAQQIFGSLWTSFTGFLLY